MRHLPARRIRPIPERRSPWPRWITPLVALTLVTAACGGSTEDVSGAENDPTAGNTESAPPAAVQELTVGVTADPWVDAPEDRKRRPNYPLNADVCETLVHLGTDFSVEPMLASEWKYVGNNTFRFTLRDDVTYSDGRPLQAEDVKAAIDYTVKEPAVGFSFLGKDSATVVDEGTVDITPEQRNLRLVEQINHPTYAIISPKDDPLHDINVTCTGPFEVASYTPEAELVVERNEKYWGEPAKLDKITFRFFPDDTTRVLALQNGEVDVINDVPQGVLSDVEGMEGVAVQKGPVGNVHLMYVARRDAKGNPKLLADPNLRRAVAAAIDTSAYVNGVLAGNAEEVDTVAPPAVLGEFADMVKGVDYDPEEAARLLDEAGWTREGDSIRTKDGEPLKLSIIFSSVDLTTAEFVQAELREVGIDAKVNQLDPGAYTEALESGDYDLDISLPNQNDANPAFLMALRFYSKAADIVPNAKIISPGADTRFDALIEKTLTAKSMEKLQRVSAEAMHELVDKEVAAIPLAGGYRIFAMSDKVRGLEVHPSGTNQRWATVYLAE